MLIVGLALDDWPSVKAIYLQGIRTQNATFETEADIPDGPAWFARHLPGLMFKGVDGDGNMLGWCALSPVSQRRAYAGVAEVSVYVAAAERGRGNGSSLLAYLVAAAESAGIWTLQAGIFPENVVSMRMHTGAGFRQVGIRERIGMLHGVWRDVVLMERRSQLV